MFLRIIFLPLYSISTIMFLHSHIQPLTCFFLTWKKTWLKFNLRLRKDLLPETVFTISAHQTGSLRPSELGILWENFLPSSPLQSAHWEKPFNAQILRNYGRISWYSKIYFLNLLNYYKMPIAERTTRKHVTREL